MPSVSKTEKRDTLSVSLVRRSYLIAVWLWLLVCLLFPTWTGTSYYHDTLSEQWRASGAFGITGSGNRFTARAPFWNPPRSSGGLTTVVRLPFAAIEAEHSIEIQIARTLWRFANGIFFAGLVILVLRWTNYVQDVDRVLLIASALAVALFTANIVLVGVGLLIDPVVIGVLAVAMALGLIVGGFVLRERDRSAPPQKITPATESTTPAPAAATDPQKASASRTLSSMQSLNWWWRIPAYLVFQFFIWGFVASQSWPVGRDVFGPYQLKPGSVVIVYWIQFALLPFLARRFQVFGLSQLLVIVVIYVLPDWPREGNEFAPFIRVPISVWPLYWIQLAATLVLFWSAPYLVKKLTMMRSQRVNGASS